MLSKDHLQSPALVFSTTLSKACQSPLSSPRDTTKGLPFPQYHQPRRPILPRCAWSEGRAKKPPPQTQYHLLQSQIYHCCLMDHRAAKETAGIYLKSKKENNTAPPLRALASSARNTARKKRSNQESHYRGEALRSREA